VQIAFRWGGDLRTLGTTCVGRFLLRTLSQIATRNRVVVRRGVGRRLNRSTDSGHALLGAQRPSAGLDWCGHNDDIYPSAEIPALEG